LEEAQGESTIRVVAGKKRYEAAGDSYNSCERRKRRVTLLVGRTKRRCKREV